MEWSEYLVSGLLEEVGDEEASRLLGRGDDEVGDAGGIGLAFLAQSGFDALPALRAEHAVVLHLASVVDHGDDESIDDLVQILVHLLLHLPLLVPLHHVCGQAPGIEMRPL